MKHARCDAEFAQESDAADTKQHLLHDARFTIAAVKMSCDPAIGFDILGNVRVEKIKRHSPDVRSPNLGQHVSLANQNSDPHRRVIRIADQLNRQIVREGFAVVLFLPTIVAQPLAKVTVTIEQAYCDEWQTKIAGGLKMIAGEYAESA